MVNSYQILNPIKSNVTYLLLENQDATLKSRIEKELDDYHNNNKFTIKDITEDIKETISVSNKFIFKKGYFFCSYIYKDISQEGVENIYISKPIYKNSDKPYCPKGEFSSIIIKNKIPLNLNIIGVIYYYKYVKNDDECVPDNLGYMTEESQITHNDNEKYVIDILYFNLLNKIDYELKYLFFKNVNYHDLKQLDYRKKLNYIEFKFKKNPNLIALSDNIEKNIFQETNQLILLINKTKKRLSIINAFSKTTNKLEKQLLVIAKQNMINDKLDCNTNKFDNYLVTCLDIKLYITKIIKDINKVITNINNVENIYSEVSNILYLFGTEKTASGDIREIGIGKSFTDNVLFDADRGNMEIIVKRRSTINKLKSNVIKLLDNIKTNVKMANDKIRQLRIEVNDVKIDENNDHITELFNIIQNYQEFNKNIDIINDGNDINPIKIFLNYIDESSSDILKTEILDKYKSKLSNEIDDNYSIKSLPETLTLIINIDIFKINKDNINNLFNKCDVLYEYLDKKDNIDFPTLYDIYFNTKNVEYDNYIKQKTDFESLQKKFTILRPDGNFEENFIKQTNLIFKPLPRRDNTFMNIYNETIKNKKLLVLNIDNVNVNINDYYNKYNNYILDIEKNYENINNNLNICSNNIKIVCNTYNIFTEYNKDINILKISTKNKKDTDQVTLSKKQENQQDPQSAQFSNIKNFIDTNRHLFSIYNKYVNHNSYYIGNNVYNICINNFSTFIENMNITDVNEEILKNTDYINVFYTLYNCIFKPEEQDLFILDEFIVIVYTFCISMLSDYPEEFFNILYHVQQNSVIKNLFDNVLHNKIILYNTENQEGVEKTIIRNIKIISEIDDNIILSEPININNNNIKKIRVIKNKLLEELPKSQYKNIRNKLFIIKYFITLPIVETESEIEILKKNINPKDINIVDLFSQNKEKNTNDINEIIDNNNNYSYDAITDVKGTNTRLCINLKKNNKFDCRLCDPTIRAVIPGLKKCPVNLPYNLDTNLYSHTNINSNLNYKGDTYRIFAYLSKPGKQLIYRREKILYGIPNNTDIFTWVVNKEYKDFILLSKTNTDNPDEIVSIKANNPDITNSNFKITDKLDKINEYNKDFYLNNFYIKNKIPASNKNNENYKFPNSHQLYIKPENSYYYIYFIENGIKYYMYLNIEDNKSIYQIVFREDKYSENEPFIKNNTKWRFVKTSDYIENIFESTKKLYNIRSKVYIDESNKNDIQSLVANNNTCYSYNTLLNNYFSADYDLINNTKFKFTGYNNNYKISSFIENTDCIFNDKDILQFDSHNKRQRKYNNKEENDEDKKYYNELLDKLKERKITYYLIKNPRNETYLYLDNTTNSDTPMIDFRSYEDLGSIDDKKIKLSNNDFVPDNFLWIVEDSLLNDSIMQTKIDKINKKYNKTLTESISNIEYNIQTKNNKKQKLIFKEQIQDASSIAQDTSNSIEERKAALKNINKTLSKITDINTGTNTGTNNISIPMSLNINRDQWDSNKQSIIKDFADNLGISSNNVIANIDDNDNDDNDDYQDTNTISGGSKNNYLSFYKIGQLNGGKSGLNVIFDVQIPNNSNDKITMIEDKIDQINEMIESGQPLKLGNTTIDSIKTNVVCKGKLFKTTSTLSQSKRNNIITGFLNALTEEYVNPGKPDYDPPTIAPVEVFYDNSDYSQDLNEDNINDCDFDKYEDRVRKAVNDDLSSDRYKKGENMIKQIKQELIDSNEYKPQQTGGSKLSMNETNITNINHLLQDSLYIKLQDYKILTQQINIIEKNSRNIFNSNISYGDTQNRVLIEYEDTSIKEKFQLYAYFSKISSEEFECNLYDIPHISKITFNYLLEESTSPFTINTFDIDNNPIDIRTNIKTFKYPEYNTVIINIPLTILNNGIDDSIDFQINSRTYRINVLKSDIHIYYNSNPLSDSISSEKISNTNTISLTKLKQTFRLRSGTVNEYNIYDFSIKLDNIVTKTKISNITNNDILQCIKTNCNMIRDFHIKQNKLFDDIEYNSKIFYIVKDTDILYINIKNTKNSYEYKIACRVSDILNKNINSDDEVNKYICKNIYTHIKLYKRKAGTIGEIFDFIVILNKNNKYAKLSSVLKTNSDNKKYKITQRKINDKDVVKHIDIIFDMEKMKDSYDNNDSNNISTEKIPNKLTIVYVEKINDIFINFNIKYTKFMNIINLYNSIINTPFIKLENINKNNEIYKKFIDDFTVIFTNISNVVNNKDEEGIGNIDTIITNIGNILNKYILSNTNNEIKLYLHTLLLSNISIVNYVINFVLSIIHIIDKHYTIYANDINKLLEADNRFIECMYKKGNLIDILYNFTNYFTDYAHNSSNTQFYKNQENYGFHFKKNNIYTNNIAKDISQLGGNKYIYILTFNDLMKYYSKIYPTLPQNKIRLNELNQPYFDLYTTYQTNINTDISNLINLTYKNIKIQSKSSKIKVTKSQTSLINSLSSDSNSFMDYNNIQFNSSESNIYITKGDVLFYNYINPNENIRNNLYNTIKMFLPSKSGVVNWSKFNEYINITPNNIGQIYNKNLNIYSISIYNKIISLKLNDLYINHQQLSLKEIIPFKETKTNIKKENNCYLELDNGIYLHLNSYKYKVQMKKLKYTNLYLIYKTIHNINYYIEFNTDENNVPYYEWVKEDYNILETNTNKLLYINVHNDKIDTVDKKEIKNADMINLEYLDRFNNTFSFVNKYINNDCDIKDTYYTIHSKKFSKIALNNNLIDILDVPLSNLGNNYILKDKFSLIGNNKLPNFKYSLVNEDCTSYIIYNPTRLLILDNTFKLVKLENVDFIDLVKNINNEINSKYKVYLKYVKKENNFIILNKNCMISEVKKIKINNIFNGQPIEKNKYFINIVDDADTNLFDTYSSTGDYTLESDKSFYIVPINNINKKSILEYNTDITKSADTKLSLIPLSSDSEYYLIRNEKNEYLYTKDIIQYKTPVRINLEFKFTNKVDENYLWYIKNNIMDIDTINILNNSNKSCMLGMLGGKKIISVANEKTKYLQNKNSVLSSNAKYLDLCNNNTNLNFINYTKIETEDDVLKCRSDCGKDPNCSGFTMYNNNNPDSKPKCNKYENKDDTSIIYYDCNKTLTEENHLGEIKNNKGTVGKYNVIDLIDNNLYYIKNKTKDAEDNDLYVTFNKSLSVYYQENYIYCSKKDSDDIYSNNVFKFNIQKRNYLDGNSKFISLLSDNKHILGSYKDENNNIIKITFDNIRNKYVWNHIEVSGKKYKWHLENTNDIFEFIINKGNPESKFYCPYYEEGYKTLKINQDGNGVITTVEGPSGINYRKMFIDKNHSIFKYIKNSPKSDNYDGNIFIVKNKINTVSYNLFSIFNSKKIYIYWDTKENVIKFNLSLDSKNTEDTIKTDPYLWNFDKYENKYTEGYSYSEKITVGKDDTLNSMRDELFSMSQTSESGQSSQNIKGGLSLSNLVNGNSYYIKSPSDQYLCANKFYKNNDGSISPVIAVSIDSSLAVSPNKNIQYEKKFMRASINLVDTKYNIYKKYSIDDDILWKLEVDKTNNTYKFYNIKHDIYISIDDVNTFQISQDATSSVYFNLRINTSSGSKKLGFAKLNLTDKTYRLILLDNSNKTNDKWIFKNPTNYNESNPYQINNEFKQLENGKIYRIINKGVKQNKEINTYLTMDDSGNELLIPKNEKLFNGKIENDPSLWKCIKNDDNTYSFIWIHKNNNVKLGNVDNPNSLFKNSGNILNFKNRDYTINNKYLTNKFYIQHSTNEYYNIINSSNLNYNISGFSNNKNYDTIKLENVNYIHKVANNSEWVLTNKKVDAYTKTNVFCEELFYYLFPTNKGELNYSFSYLYNSYWNNIYSESNLTTKNNELQEVIVQNKDPFRKYKGFTLETIINSNISDKNSNKGFNYMSIVLTTGNVFYNIRFINYDENTLLIRITENSISDNSNKIIIIQNNLKTFKQLDFSKRSTGNEIKMNICAPDIYTNNNIFNETGTKIHLTYDKEFVNIYINNKLITFFRILNKMFQNIYYSSNIEMDYNDIRWWKHDKLIDVPLWRTKNIDNFNDGKPGIEFVSKIKPTVKFQCYIEQKKIGYFYIKDKDNKYLSIDYKDAQLEYNIKWITKEEILVNDDNCLWQLFDTNINKARTLKVINNSNMEDNTFRCLGEDLDMISNTTNSYWDDFNNSTNLMLKAKINKSTSQIDSKSNYSYSVIDIDNEEGNIQNKECYWTHNSHGHTAIDYDTYKSGSHFTSDLWNIQFILGVNPKIDDKFFVRYKENKGTIVIDNIKNQYPIYKGETTLHGRWNEWDKIKDFSSIKSQQNIYIDNIIDTGSKIGANDICISLNDDSTAANCMAVSSSTECSNTENALLYKKDETCENVQYKNYRLLDGLFYGGNMKGGNMNNNNNNMEGGSIWVQEKYFYLLPKIKIENITHEIHHNIVNVKYIPAFNEADTADWEWTTTEERNVIYNKILNNFRYDGYIEEKTESKNIIRAVVLPQNYVLLYSKETAPNYIYGELKIYNTTIKNIKIATADDFFNGYVNNFVKIQPKLDNTPILQTTNNELSIINKCTDLIKNNLCIPYLNKSKVGSNITNISYLKKKNVFNIENNIVRIINVYGNYLSDIYVTNTFYCPGQEFTDIIFQKQFNSIHLKYDMDNPHFIHTTSQESLWTFKCNKDESNDECKYKIENIYSGKNLSYTDENGEIYTDFYVEYSTTKYFKQQILKKNTSEMYYNSEDLYHIYIIDKISKKKLYLNYKNVLVNNKYNNSASILFNSIPQEGFIIQNANYNLDVLTDDNKEINKDGNIISNICYNKTKTCISSNQQLSLLENNFVECLNIITEVKKLAKEDDSNSKDTIYNYDLFDLLLKSQDKFLVINQAGKYEIKFRFKNKIDISQIKYQFSGLFKNIKEVSIIVITKNGDKKTIDTNVIKSLQKSYEKSIDINTDNIYEIIIKIDCDYGFKLNYVEIFGKANSTSTKNITESKMTVENIFEQFAFNRALVSQSTNIKKNAVHIKYIETPITNPSNINNTKNLLHINNTINKISISDKLNNSEFINKFILVFNPLLNVYMFLINNNNYLSIDNEYYFKLIRINQLSDKTNVFNIQSFKNNNLYINYKNNKISLGNETTAFSLVNFTPSKKEILNYNNCLNNNILFNNDTKIIYLKDSVEYFDVITNDEFRKNATKKKIKLKQVDNNKWELISIKDNNIKVTIENLINSSSSDKPNIYSFKTSNGQNFINMEIGLYNNYNDLQIESYSYFKKLLSFNDINKILPNTNEYQGQIERANLYKNNEFILDKIYLDDIITISMGEKILYGKENNGVTLKTEVSTESKIGKYFVEIALESDTPNLYKLWNIDYEKLIIYDENSGINNVSLSSKSIKYNDIDRKADLNVQSVFEKIQEGNKYSYKLYNTSSNIYINPTELLKPNFSVKKIHSYGKKPIDIYKNKPYTDYCYEICKTNNIITDKLIQVQTYNVDMRDKDSPIALFLNESSIKIINTIPNNDDYYAIDDAEINYMAQDELFLNDIKEHITLKKLFNIDTIELTKQNIESINKTKIKIKIITIELLVNSTNKKFNFILFRNNSDVGTKKCIGRFESSYNKPDKFVPDTQKSIKIFYDLNNVNLDFSKESGKQKSFDLISYTEAPVIDEQKNTKYVKLKNMNINIIQNYKISLFHINNTVPTNTIVDADEDTSKINVRKVYSTCYWGDCTDFNKMSQVEKNNIIDNIKQYEQMRSFQMGGFLDRNMIRFIRKEYKTKKKYIHFSNASLSSAEKGYVSKNVNYYKNNTLNDILFKQNDILEIHKVFGSRGWSNSYNSFYHKSKFLINKITDITENDYYDSFRNIYPVTWIEKRFVNNAENLWKYDNWFADSPHFRSLPNFKFEEVQIIEKADEKTDLLPTIKLSGGNITINQKYMILIAVLILILIILYCGLF